MFYAAAPSETTGTLTRTWVGQIGKSVSHNNGKSGVHRSVDWYGHEETCKVETKISAIATILPGGNDRRGLVNDNAFTAIVLWYFPFSPGGYVVPPNTSAARLIKGALGDKEGDQVVENFEHMPWISRFAFTATVGTGVVKTLEGGAALSKGIKASADTVKSLERMGSVAEKLHDAHSIFDTGKFDVVNIVNVLSRDHYPVMGAVIRGVFTSIPNSQNKALISSTSLAMTIAKSDFPDITMKVVRQAKPNDDSDCPQSGAPQLLPWVQKVTGCQPVFNPWSSQPTNMISVAPQDITRGAAAVQKIVEATKGLDSLAGQSHYADDVFDNLGNIQKLVQPPDCPNDSGPQNQESNTICWVFKDGRP